MDLIRWEIEQQIEGLSNQVKQYQNIVSLQKESLQLAKDKESYDKSVAKKVKELADLQARIAKLSLDDSREAQAERRKLEGDLAELQEQLADEQSQYAYDAQVDSLDKMADAYEKEKDEEIKVLEKSISSQEKIYRAAISRIETQWSTLYQDIINYNYEAGSTIESEIVEKWGLASEAVQRYGGYLQAVASIQGQLDSLGGGSLSPNVVSNSSPEYEGDTNQTRAAQATRLIQQLISLSQAWHAAAGDTSRQKSLADQAKALGEGELSSQLGRSVVRGTNGVWYLDNIGGKELFATYYASGIEALIKKYHTGGVAGDASTTKDNEVLALLEKGEMVLDERKKAAVYEVIDLAAYMADKFGTSVSKLSAFSLGGGGAFGSVKSAQDAALRDANNITTQNNIGFNIDVHIGGGVGEAEAYRIGQGIGDGAIDRLNEAASRRGIGTLSGLTLRQ
jgi:hypothetical protein